METAKDYCNYVLEKIVHLKMKLIHQHSSTRKLSHEYSYIISLREKSINQFLPRHAHVIVRFEV